MIQGDLNILQISGLLGDFFVDQYPKFQLNFIFLFHRNILIHPEKKYQNAMLRKRSLFSYLFYLSIQ